MPHPEADRNLLFGINALQNDFITRDALIAAMNAWVVEKHRAIGEILVERGDLNPTDRGLLDQLIDRHIARHGGDPTASLAVLNALSDVTDDLRHTIADTDVQQSLASIKTDPSGIPRENRAMETTDFSPTGTRFRKVRDHAKGGLGIVFVARDEELHREVALKEIQDRHADDLDKRARFLMEAEVTGGLEHPGIVPVYALGHYEDGRPFYAMRFIKGDSLKEAIGRFHADQALKHDPGQRLLALQKLLRRFLDVCNAVAYAHSRGILHRDLKPDNVMVGKYGETLVVDWGLAKAVGRSGADSSGELPESTSLYLSASGSVETLPGSVIGTPAYMSPEQAAGNLDLLGPRSDVYSLGATLYSLLADRVPFAEKTLHEVFRKVERGEFPRPREASPWVDPALEAICMKAMSLRPDNRYASPQALADDLEHWLADEPVIAYPEPFTRRASRWVKKHQTALATVASAATVAALLLGGIAGARIAERRKTDALALATLGQANILAIEARTTGDLAGWDKAIAEARRARERLESGGGSLAISNEVESRLEAFIVEKTRRWETLEVEEKDRRVVADLDEARLQGANLKDDHFDTEAKLRAYLTAFNAYGIDVGTLAVEDAARRIRSSKVGDDLISALVDWANYTTFFDVPTTRLQEIVRAAETDSIRLAILHAFVHRDADALRRICEREEDRRKLGTRLRSVFEALLWLDPAVSFPLLEAIRRDNPSDFWLNHDLGMSYQKAKPPQVQKALNCLSAAVALRPNSPGVHLNLGLALEADGDRDAAIAEFRAAIRLNPEYGAAYISLGNALDEKGDRDGAISKYAVALRIKPNDARAHNNYGVVLAAKGDLDSAIAEHRAALRINPEYAMAHSNLGAALEQKGDRDGAIAEFRAALRINPELAIAHLNLGMTLDQKGDREAALVEFRTTLRLNPDDARAHYSVGILLGTKGDHDGAIVEHRAALRINPSFAEAHLNLGAALETQGDRDGAISEYRAALRINPEYAKAHFNLGVVLSAKGDRDGAISEYRASLRINPDDARAHYGLGIILRTKGDLDGAISEYRAAIHIDPEYAEAHCNLGLIQQGRGLFAEALGLLARGHELGTKRAGWRYPSAQWVSDCRRLIELEGKLPAILKGETSPRDAGERLIVGEFCRQRRLYNASVRFIGEAFTEQPALADNLARSYRYNAACAAALAGSGQGRDEPMPDEAARAKLREKALGWLRADLTLRAEVLNGAGANGRKALVKELDHWKEDPDLAGIRDEAALERLSEAEREVFRTLWTDVETLCKKAAGDGGL